MSEVSTIIPASTSEFPVLTFMKASSTVIIPEDVFSNSPVMLRFPVMVVLPVNVIFPVLPANDKGVLVTPPSLIVKLKFLSCLVCAIVTSPELAVIVNSCSSPTNKPASASMVKAPVVVSAASALKKLPPAITVAEVFVVPLTSTALACAEFPEKLAPQVEFNVIPEATVANPFAAKGVLVGEPPSGVNASFDNTATLVLPTNIDAIVLLTLDAVTVSIFQPESVCPEVKTGPNN